MAAKTTVATDMVLMPARAQGAVNEPMCQALKVILCRECDSEASLSPDTGTRGVENKVYDKGAMRTGKTTAAAVPIVSPMVHGGTSSMLPRSR
jgi:hypothetical protein